MSGMEGLTATLSRAVYGRADEDRRRRTPD